MSKIGYILYLIIVLTALAFAVGLVFASWKEEQKPIPVQPVTPPTEVVG